MKGELALGVLLALCGDLRAAVYLIAADPTPNEDAGYPASLYALGGRSGLRSIRELGSEKDGVYSVQIDYQRRIAVLGMPHFQPSRFVVVDMDHPSTQKSFAREFPRSSVMNTHLVDLPGQGLTESVSLAWEPEERGADGSSRPLTIGDHFLVLNHALVGLKIDNGGDVPLYYEDLRFVVLGGASGAGVDGGDYIRETTSVDRMLRIRCPDHRSAEMNVRLPNEVPADEKHMLILWVSNREILAIELGSDSDKVRIYDRAKKTWGSFDVPGDRNWIRGFGPWVAVAVGEEDRSGRRLSPGTERTAGRARIGHRSNLAERFAVKDAYLSGMLILINGVSGKRYEINAKVGDSEVLLVDGESVYYRISDRLYMGRLGANSVEDATQILQSPEILDCHWAFIGPDSE